ncbi:hypothetical protein [Spirochaeta thermophila]|uniref:hypothetical protein n=1 Tax=Winmispira thermophila TaxID=154 RepID=UPI0001F111CD|nr:hypothetical protein [Spirochaeta thermophila]
MIGTAGVVYPAASIPHIAERAGAHIIEINPEPSSYTERITEVYLPLRAAEAAILLARHLEIDLDL